MKNNTQIKNKKEKTVKGPQVKSVDLKEQKSIWGGYIIGVSTAP